MKRIAFAGLAVLALASTLLAQNRSSFAGRYEAIDYGYGAPGVLPGPLRIITGSTLTSSTYTVTLATGRVVTADGTVLFPITTNTPLLVGTSGNQETVTPTAVSGCNYDSGYGGCSVTAAFTYAHGNGDAVISGTFGLQEAINYAAGAGGWGALVNIDSKWTAAGGTAAMIALVTPTSLVAIEDTRAAPFQFWAMEPNTLTSLAVPATQTTSTVTWTGSGLGTRNGSYYVCVTYVDMLGGEGPCSLTSAALASGTNFIMNVASPAASTGAVGYRVYAGTAYASAYLLPITSTTCTLSNKVVTVAACAIGSAYVQPTLFVTTTQLRPQPQSSLTVNVNQPLPQGHTTFAYQPVILPFPFQVNFGPFPAYGALSAGQIAILGTAQLPPGFLNVIGRAIRVTGKVALTTLNTATLPYITLSLGWAGGDTAGLPVSVCALVPAAAGATATANESFSCTLTTNAVGTTAVGSIMTNGWENTVAATGGAILGGTIDTGTAAIGSLGLFSQDSLNVIYTSTTNATGGEQLLALNIEVLQ